MTGERFAVRRNARNDQACDGLAGRLNSNVRLHSSLVRGVLLIRLQFVNALFPVDLDFGRWLRCSLKQG